MDSTIVNYASTINVEQIRTDVLEDMLTDMYKKINKIREEMVLIEDELSRRKYGDKK